MRAMQSRCNIFRPGYGYAMFGSILSANAPSANVGSILTEALPPIGQWNRHALKSRYTVGMAKEGGTVNEAPRGKEPASKGPDMRVTIAGVAFRSPVIAASGTFGYGVEFEEV